MRGGIPLPRPAKIDVRTACCNGVSEAENVANAQPSTIQAFGVDFFLSTETVHPSGKTVDNTAARVPLSR
jgi:hypothetical protein